MPYLELSPPSTLLYSILVARMLPSSPAEIKVWVPWTKHAVLTFVPVACLIVCLERGVMFFSNRVVSQTLQVPSSDAVTKNAWSGAAMTLLTAAVCSENRASRCPVGRHASLLYFCDSVTWSSFEVGAASAGVLIDDTVSIAVRCGPKSQSSIAKFSTK